MAVTLDEATKSGQELYVVGMGELVVTASPDTVLSCIGLGSCVAVCAYDGQEKIGGLAHIVLPQNKGLTSNNPAKFADTAVPLLLDEIVKKGGTKSRLMIKLAGGAQMTLAPGLRDTFKTGERNLAQVLLVLQREKLAVAAADIGGSVGRTVKMYIGTGQITVKTAHGVAQEL